MIHTITKKQVEEFKQLAYSINKIFFDNDSGEIGDEYSIYFNGINYTNDLFFHEFRNYIHIINDVYDDNFYQIAGEDDATDDINLAMEEMQIFNANVPFDELMNDLKDDLNNLNSFIKQYGN